MVLKKGTTLYDLYKERCPLYEKYADITVNVDNMTIEQAIEAMRAAVEAVMKGVV